MRRAWRLGWLAVAAAAVLASCECENDVEPASPETLTPAEPAPTKATAVPAPRPAGADAPRVDEPASAGSPAADAAAESEVGAQGAVDAGNDAAATGSGDGAAPAVISDSGAGADAAGESAEAADGRSMEPELIEVPEGGLHIVRMVMARAVEDRTPVDERTAFSAAEGGEIYAFFEVSNPDRAEREISVSWASAATPENAISRVVVNVGAQPRWRTWAYTTALWRRPGRYLAVVRDHEERIIARAPFEVVP